MRLVAALLFIGSCYAATDSTKLPPELQGIGIEQHLGAALPLDTTFRDEQGRTVALRQFFGQRPVLLALVYYRCPMLCTQILSGVVSGLRPLTLTTGRDFDVIAISIDPEDTPQTAAANGVNGVHSSLLARWARGRLAFPDRRRSRDPGGHGGSRFSLPLRCEVKHVHPCERDHPS